MKSTEGSLRAAACVVLTFAAACTRVGSGDGEKADAYAPVQDASRPLAALSSPHANGVAQMSRQNAADASTVVPKTAGFGYQLPYQYYPVTQRGTPSMALAVAVADVTGDARDDAVVLMLSQMGTASAATDHKVAIHVQNASGQLSPPTFHDYSSGLYERVNNLPYVSVAIGDMNLDGQNDIVAGYSKGITILLGNGNQFSSQSVLGAPEFRGLPPWNDNQFVRLTALFDVDRDGYKDVIAFNSGTGATLFVNDRKGGIARVESVLPQIGAPTDLKVTDFDHDGADDLVVLSGHRSTRRFWLIKGGVRMPPTIAATWSLVGDETYGGIAVGDWNRDGRVDLAISVIRPVGSDDYTAGVLVFPQEQLGVLGAPSLVRTWHYPTALLTADLDGDRASDLLIDHPGWDLSYHLGRDSWLGGSVVVNDRYQTDIVTQGDGPQVISVGDLNGDGCKDLARAEIYAHLMVYFGVGCQRLSYPTGGPGQVHASD